MAKINHFLVKQTLNLPRYAKQVLAIYDQLYALLLHGLPFT